MENAVRVAAQKHAIIKTSEFMSYPEVHCQRDTQKRVFRTAKLLIEKPSVRHIEVAVGEYPNGLRVVLDGNTRRLAWQTYSDKVDVPSHVLATIYQVNNDKHAEEIYETFDSAKAVENSKDKIYSALRTVWGDDYMWRIQSNTIKKGIFTSAMRQATTITKDSDTDKPTVWNRESIADIRRTIYYYSDELKTIDHVLATKGTRDVNQAMIAAGLIALKNYGHNNAKLIVGLRKWFTGDWNPTVATYNGAKVDGICWLVRYAAQHPFYGQYIGQTRQDQMHWSLDLYLYCIDLYMKGLTLKNINEMKLMGYYKSYAKRNNFSVMPKKADVESLLISNL